MSPAERTKVLNSGKCHQLFRQEYRSPISIVIFNPEMPNAFALATRRCVLRKQTSIF
jgi:hypothetical protein